MWDLSDLLPRPYENNYHYRPTTCQALVLAVCKLNGDFLKNLKEVRDPWLQFNSAPFFILSSLRSNAWWTSSHLPLYKLCKTSQGGHKSTGEMYQLQGDSAVEWTKAFKKNAKNKAGGLVILRARKNDQGRAKTIAWVQYYKTADVKDRQCSSATLGSLYGRKMMQSLKAQIREPKSWLLNAPESKKLVLGKVILASGIVWGKKQSKVSYDPNHL